MKNIFKRRALRTIIKFHWEFFNIRNDIKLNFNILNLKMYQMLIFYCSKC